MANMIRKIRFSVGLGEMHSTYQLLDAMKRNGELSNDPYLEGMRITLKRKLMEEEEGLLTVAYEVREFPKAKKNSMEGLGFNGSIAVELPSPKAADFNDSFMEELNRRLEQAKKDKENGNEHE